MPVLKASETDSNTSSSMALCKEAGRTSSAGLLVRLGEVTRQCLGELHKAEDDTHDHRHSSPGPSLCVQTWNTDRAGNKVCHVMAPPS